VVKLENVTAEIRPRGRWESIDLGCALVRENYGRVMGAWFLFVLPLWIGIVAMSQLIENDELRPWVAGLICIWSIPLCDRIPLFVLSRRLFGEDSDWRTIFRALPRMLLRLDFVSVLLGPLALSRGLATPVRELEELRGSAYRERVNLLSRNGGEGASQAALISLVLVLSSMFSMLFIYAAMLGLFGDSLVWENFWVEHIVSSDAAFMPAAYGWFICALVLSAVSLIEPFYVGAGFAMYINSRTVTEGWDIELAFKRMNRRVSALKRGSGGLMLLLTGLVFATFSKVEGSNQVLDEVMAQEEFTIHSEIIEVPVPRVREESSPSNFSLGWLSGLSHLLFWVLGVIGVCLLAWLLYRNRYLLQGGGSTTRKDVSHEVSSVMGMDVTSDSLPEDIVQAARMAWDAGQQHEALSLLYRGAIAAIVQDDSVVLLEYFTELDCLRAIRHSENKSSVDYFSKLTDGWMRHAYGGELLANTEAAMLFDSWPYGRGGSA
jgi:hypothetical protein